MHLSKPYDGSRYGICYLFLTLYADAIALCLISRKINTRLHSSCISEYVKPSVKQLIKENWP